jgi:flagellum-specific peptidoglycan hydrolase FlgJ
MERFLYIANNMDSFEKIKDSIKKEIWCARKEIKEQWSGHITEIINDMSHKKSMPHNPQRRKIMTNLWVISGITLVTWSASLAIAKQREKINNNKPDERSDIQIDKSREKEYTITLEWWDTVRWRMSQLYKTLWIDKALETIYPDQYIVEHTEGLTVDKKKMELIRFNVFFIALQEDLYFIQENKKDVYTSFSSWDTLAIKPSTIVKKIADDRDLMREERELRLKKRAENKRKKNSKNNDTPPSLTEIQEELKAKREAQKEAKRKQQKKDNAPKPENKENKENNENKEKWKKITWVETYIQDNAVIAQEEMKKHWIPASIKLAQGILEWKYWTSRLAKKANNHFGMKCFEHRDISAKNTRIWNQQDAYYVNGKKCCINAHDDNPYDMFKVYPSNKESFRAHSELIIAKGRYTFLLTDNNNKKEWDEHFLAVHGDEKKNNKKKEKYRKLYPIRKEYWDQAFYNRNTEYKKRAYGLSAMWYATSTRYPQKIMKLIETYNLTQYDE